jgi:hypothetical protein
MAVALVLDQMTLPSMGTVKLQLDYTFDLKISAEAARRQAHTWLIGEVSYMIRAGEPTLVIGQAATGEWIALWRVPAILTATHLGDVGEAGYIDIAVESGEMLDPAQRATEILNRAGNLAASMPPYTPIADTPAAFLATHLKPTITAPSGNPLAILQITK